MNKFKIGITMGDPAGVGPEVIVKALAKIMVKKALPLNFLIIGDRKIIEIYIKKFKLRSLFERNLDFFDLNNITLKNFKPGISKPEYGLASLEYINTAIDFLKKKKISALVTAPVNKEMINKAKINFSGHTEYLSSCFGLKDTLMMLLNRYMRVVPLTRHIALRNVGSYIKPSFIYTNIKSLITYLKKYFCISFPRIAVCSLNPHGGEGGTLGNEEERVILPVIRRLNKGNLAQISGPYSADGLFSKYKRDKYDCIVGMYHDQVMIPIKIVDPEHTVNITLGLPFVRTSPGHGTAFDIAGKGIASSISMVEAIKLAYQLTRNAFSF